VLATKEVTKMYSRNKKYIPRKSDLRTDHPRNASDPRGIDLVWSIAIAWKSPYPARGKYEEREGDASTRQSRELYPETSTNNDRTKTIEVERSVQNRCKGINTNIHEQEENSRN